VALEQRPCPCRARAPRLPLAENDLRAAFGDTDDWRERYRTTVELDDEGSRAA
jgi:hypothetical protein